MDNKPNTVNGCKKCSKTEKEQTERLYKFLLKNTGMGMETTASILSVYDGHCLADEIAYQNNEFRKIYSKTKKQLGGAVQNAGLSLKDKFMTDFMVKMRLKQNNTDSNIAEMTMKGCNVGVIDAIKAINTCPDADPKAISLAKRLIDFETGTNERMKHFL